MKQIIKKGDKFGRLTAIRFNHRDQRSNQHWLFMCDCGTEKVIKVNSVKMGYTKSCGCLLREKSKINGLNMKTHGMRQTRTYRSWASMKTRCLNKKEKGYKHWGGRGIVICSKWLDNFENFYKDMGERPKNTSLDRIDNNGNYYKENCRWATPTEQNNNYRRNHLITYNNKTQNVKQWALYFDINYSSLLWRINNGWSIKRAFNL